MLIIMTELMCRNKRVAAQALTVHKHSASDPFSALITDTPESLPPASSHTPWLFPASL